MTKILLDLYRVLTRTQRLQLFRLQFLVILMAFIEVVGVASIGPFLSLASNSKQIEEDNYFSYLFNALEISTVDDFVFFAGLAVLVLLTIATIISTITVRFLLKYAQELGAAFSSSLYEHYMNKSWMFHASGNSSQLMSNTNIECARVTHGIIYPVMIMNAKIVLAICIIIFLITLNPIISIGGFVIFSLIYSIIFLYVRKRLTLNGLAITNAQRARFRLMNEGFGGIKDVMLLGRSSTFSDQYRAACNQYSYAMGWNATLNEVPKFWVELIAFGAMVSLILFLLITNNGNMNSILPQLGIYAMASYKLLPAFQQVYGNLTHVRGTAPALDSIKDDLLDWKSWKANKKIEKSKKSIFQ